MNSGEDELRMNGFPLISDMTGSSTFGNAFDYLFTRDYESSTSPTNKEVIFQLVFDDYNTSLTKNSAVNTLYGHADSHQGWLKPSDFITEDIAKTSGRNVFDDRNNMMDARMYENCNMSSSTTCINKYTTRQTTISADTKEPKATYRNWWDRGANGSNWIIYRLSDIMLLKAEALTQKLREGSDTETINFNEPILNQAFTLVNAVNKRSVCQNLSAMTDTLVAGDFRTKEQMETLVLKERQRELMFEGKRWYDLVRRARRDGSTAVLSQAALQKVTSGSALISNKLSKMDAIYWPYNYEELKVNTLLKQNPAFSSGDTSSYE